MTERTETLEQWAQRVEGARRKIEALSPAEQEQGARFTQRYWALNAAVGSSAARGPYSATATGTTS